MHAWLRLVVAGAGVQRSCSQHTRTAIMMIPRHVHRLSRSRDAGTAQETCSRWHPLPVSTVPGSRHGCGCDTTTAAVPSQARTTAPAQALLAAGQRRQGALLHLPAPILLFTSFRPFCSRWCLGPLRGCHRHADTENDRAAALVRSIGPCRQQLSVAIKLCATRTTLHTAQGYEEREAAGYS